MEQQSSQPPSIREIETAMARARQERSDAFAAMTATLLDMFRLQFGRSLSSDGNPQTAQR